ncbi:helix-turn-helix transcriptional regulator [Phocoenobacter atlanticus]|uniref:helix-turn-helix transcriptional regulator n=1 Tax=Phocoenobacter atlanticus TaxID=3416742 RepID=UPI00276108A3|nr:AlpA family phage regulatory protein [Pasteurella atlantica]MDP8101480.1 AlpA family phage regulatory protein [Pasteurella atlantica]
MKTEKKKERFIDFLEVKHRTGLSRSTMYEFIKKGIFPQSINIGTRNKKWLESDIDCWIAEQIIKNKQEKK